MVAGFSVLSLALDAQTDIVTTQRIVSDVEIQKLQERFGIAVSTDVNDQLEISVSNLGQNPVEISSIWIINKTLATEPAKRFSINYDDSIVTGSSIVNVLESQPLFMIPDIYGIKVISSLGTIEIAELDVGPGGSSSNNLRSVLVTDPPDVIMGQNVTIAMVVTNTGQLSITDVTPSTPSVNPPGAEIESSPPNLSSVDLIPGESFLFLWDYTIDGTVDTNVDFSNFATGLDINNNFVQSNIASDTSILREDASGDSSEEVIVLTQDLLAKPEIFITMPVPFGRSVDDALWGVTIVNPIDKDLEVSKVVFTTTSSRYTGGDEIFDDGNNNLCDAKHVNATMAGTWSCPAPNQLMWESLSAPVTVPGLSSVEFLALVLPGKLNGSTDFLETVPVGVTVYTTLGQFGKTGYGTSFFDSRTTLPVLYLTDVPGSVDPTNIRTSVNAIPSGSVVKLNATLADFDTDPTRIIQGTDSRIIINIPKGWTNPSIIDPAGFTITPIAPPFPDGSSQIIGTLNSDMTGSSDAQTIEFQVTAPTVTSTQLYIMYILADGVSNSGIVGEDAAVGSLSEMVLQVIP